MKKNKVPLLCKSSPPAEGWPKAGVVLFLIAFALSACTTQTKHRGYIFPDDAAELLASAKTQRDVERAFGSPNAATLYGGDWWIYYGMDENYRGPFPLMYDNRRALIVQFDEKRNVKFAKIYEDSELPKAPRASTDETEVPAAIELNMFQELINNVGRFKPGT
ncbi:MAG: outer membrane protein assembly factor BamE [Rickettsiales bacterium]|jgi:outer membrane protein assembly factor BamE (lipoprotein component of BamABCDE complex)|nr:outer membrane protein assembly factor BamE [Rickettsiales bacterium]